MRTLAVGATRAKLISKMILLSLQSSPLEVMDDVWRWKTKAGKQLAPTTMFGYFTAIKVASNVINIVIPTLPYKRHLRSCKKDLALHERKRAIPLEFADLKEILSDLTIEPEVRHAILFCWGLALRLGNLTKILNRDIQVMSDTLVRIRVRGLKGSDLGLSNKYRWVETRGLFVPLMYRFRQAALREPDSPFLSISRARMVYALKNFDNDLSAHSVRRGAAQHLANKGFSMAKIQALLDHKSIAMTEIYIDPTRQQPHVGRALRNLAALARA